MYLLGHIAIGFEPVTEEAMKDLTKDIEYAREGLFTKFQRELSFGNEKLALLLYGRADKIIFDLIQTFIQLIILWKMFN